MSDFRDHTIPKEIREADLHTAITWYFMQLDGSKYETEANAYEGMLKDIFSSAEINREFPHVLNSYRDEWDRKRKEVKT